MQTHKAVRLSETLYTVQLSKITMLLSKSLFSDWDSPNFCLPLQLRKLEEAIDDCTNAVKLDDTYIKAYLRRAQW